MMTKKILFLLTFLLTTLGGGNLAWAQTTVGYTEEIDGTTVGARVLSNGDLDHLEISDPIKGSLISDYSGTSKDVYDNGTKLASTDSWRKDKKSTAYDDEQYVGYTLTVDDGYCLNISNVAAKLLVGDNTYYWKVVIYDKDGTAQYNSSPNRTADQSTTEDLSEPTSISNLTGTVTVKLFLYQDGNTKYFCINYLQLEVNISRMPYSDTYPYTWDFTTWQTTSADLSADSHWNEGTTTVSYKSNLNGGSALLLGGGELPETKGLVFNTDEGKSSRVVAYPNNYLQMYSTTVTVPSLKAGNKVTFTANIPAGHTSEAIIKAGGSSGTEINKEEKNGKFVFTYTVPSDGSVDFWVNANAVDPQQLLSIKVEKGDFAFSEHHTQYWDGTSSTNTKSGTYKAGTTNFSVRANVPAGASVSKENFTVNSSSDAIDVSNWGFSNSKLANGEIWFNNLVVNKSGVAELTFTFKETDAYNSKSFTVLVNVVKGNIPYFEYTNYDKNKDERAFSASPINKTMKYETSEDRLPPFDDVTFTSSNTEVATVNSSTGIITFVKPGISVITATFAGNDRYYGAETYFTLVVTGTENTGTINWTETLNTPTTPPSPYSGQITLTLGDHAIEYPATSSLGGEVKYMSTDNDIVTVNASTGAIEAKHPGVAYIYAYQEGAEGQSWIYNDYKVQVNGGSISIGFEPESATITTGRILMPRLSIPSLEKADITSLTLTVEPGGESYVSVSPNLLLDEFLEMQGYTIAKVHPRITGLAATSSPVKVTAHFVSPYYNNGAELTADFYVTVTNNTGNFSWATSKTEFTIVEGEYMMMPSITGNANGNIDGLSKGSVNQARQGYVYEIKGSNRSITYNTEDYYYGQGVPDYTLTPAAVNGGEAYIYWIKGMDDSHPALMIYGESAGDLTLTATDSQTGYSPGNITIHVVSKDERVKENETTFWNSNKFPFTWDFTNIAPADITDDEVHWKTKYYGTVSSNAMDLVTDAASGCHLLGMASSFDYNYSDEQDTDNLIAKNKSGKDPQAIAKYICNGEGSDCKVMPAFHGIRIALGNNSQGRFHHKRDKVRIHDTTTDDPRLYLEGGMHYLYLPAVGSSKTPGTAYKLFMKVKGHVYQAGDAGNSSHVDVHVLSDDKGDPSTTTIASEYVITMGVESVIGFDIPAEHAGKAVRLGFDKNVDVYWIALSTEEKLVKRQSNTTYHAATYSYGQDLDIVKSQEANKDVTAYYTTSFSNGKTLYMTPITNSQTTVPSGTGIMLKADKGESFDDVSSYMVASARNTDNYITPSSLSGNLLVATPSTGTVASQETIQDKTYTNFLLSYRYKTYDWEDGSTVNNDYTDAPDWVFYRIKPGGIATASNMAYLHVEGNMFVDANGNIVNLSRRNSASEETDNQDGPIAPASQNMLKIIFLDEDPIEDSGTTDISTVNERTIDTDAWYTLQGVRVNAPAKGGIYIHKGKKVVVK